MALKIYNTLTRKKEEFIPLHKGEVGIYVCGPTVYSGTHLGHAKSYISFDVVVRYLRWLDYKVKYVQNITDAGHLLDSGEDRILKGAKREKLDPIELTEKYTRTYFEDMDALGILRPDISPRATGHIPEQIKLIEILIEKGYAYETNGTVYFDITKFPEYGKLSHRKVEEQVAGVRVEVRTEKKHPADFALWILAPKEHIMKWDSPWGVGYPGWHLECSAMSMKYLGETLDIHGGGIDNIFPHHECEIAQSKAATGKQFVRYWMHNNMVLVDGVKMSKSLGNFITIKEILKKYSPEQVRFFILTTHYRSPIDFSDKAIQGAGEGMRKIHNTFERINETLKQVQGDNKGTQNDKRRVQGNNEGVEDNPASEIDKIIEVHKKKFVEAMNDDFNTPLAIGALFDFSRELNKYLDNDVVGARHSMSLQSTLNIYEEFGGKILGILPFSKKAEIEGTQFIELLIEVRERLRADKQWKLADEIRSKLQDLGIYIEDKSGKTTWRRN